ncbi:hypothetical protein ElyMa_002387400 [Elysia marginata]|uniref:ABC transmembrane type-1 domain-containing protein n=1 Tax=Elysia marginata TaxID=1093978 RepID=A0AAV4GC41_9GAST|nr:hypothetical protein ElyMa_002387400 [Elysia marginata]
MILVLEVVVVVVVVHVVMVVVVVNVLAVVVVVIVVVLVVAVRFVVVTVVVKREDEVKNDATDNLYSISSMHSQLILSILSRASCYRGV